MTENLRPEALARQIVVRYRGDGHVRFGLPDLLCAEAHAATIEEGLRRQPGVYRVTLYRRQGKLSVFYDPHACALNDIARRLHGVLGTLTAPKREAGKAQRWKEKLDPRQWFKKKAEQAKVKAEEWRFKAKLLKDVVTYHPQMNKLFTEQAVINFFNDLVTFYLIKMHWDLITQRWVRQPIRYRNAWATTFYLVFLLVRSRKKAAKKP